MKKTLFMVLVLFASPAFAETPGAVSEKVATPISLDPAEQLERKEEELRRMTRIADNARKEVERLRADIALKDELIALGIERNAELYAITREVIDQGLSKRSVEPFLQTQRVKMENLQQDYVDRAHAARIYPETLPPSVQQKLDQEAAGSN